MTMQKNTSPWAWIPTLYMAEGAPYFAVNTLAVIFLSQMGLSNSEVAYYTGWLYLPWVIKPFWSPILDLFGKKRMWVVFMQLIVAISLAGVAFCAPLDSWMQSTLAFFWLCAFASATHDIAADGLYIISLDTNQQSFFVGIRNTFYRISTVLCQWAVLNYVQHLYDSKIVELISNVTWNFDNCRELSISTYTNAWQTNFYILSGLFLIFAIYHFITLPKDKGSKSWLILVVALGIVAISPFVISGMNFLSRYIITIKKFSTDLSTLSIPFLGIGTYYIINKLTKNQIGKNFKSFASKFTEKDFIITLLFIFTYRLGEAQLGKIAMLFMKDSKSNGGLGLDTGVIGDVYGLVGVIALVLGGILGGIVVSKYGLKKMMFPMLLFMNIPNLVYVFLSTTQTVNMPVIYTMVAIEQFGYGFGFTAFTLYLVYISQGEYSTTHYAICTGLMALGMMIPGMYAGDIQESLGYTNFFIWVCICTIPPFIIAPLLKIDKDFGIKSGK